MVKLQTSTRTYTLNGKLGELHNSYTIRYIVFSIPVKYEEWQSHRTVSDSLFIFPGMVPITLNGIQYKLISSEDVIKFRSILEAACLEDILTESEQQGIAEK